MIARINRRETIALLGGAAAWPLTARAQQRPAKPVIGFISSASPVPYAPFLSAFHNGLKGVGYVEGQNLAIEYRWAEFQYDRLPAMAADLVSRRVTVIAASTALAALAVKAATATIPIVFTAPGDPVALGWLPALTGRGECDRRELLRRRTGIKTTGAAARVASHRDARWPARQSERSSYGVGDAGCNGGSRAHWAADRRR
jgi:hypothetical protein